MKLRKIQDIRLRKILIHAYRNFAFYRKRFDTAGFNPFDYGDISDLRKLPILSKEEYRDFTQHLVRSDPEKYKGWYVDGTSGSTGIPLKIYRTWRERAYMSAKWMRTLFLNGYRLTDNTYSLPSPHRLQRDSLLQKFGFMRRTSIPYTAPVHEMVESYVNSCADILYANKSQLVQMAEYINTNNVRIQKPRIYVSAAETLDKASKRIITSVFGLDNLFEVYGAVEFNVLAWQIVGQQDFQVSHSTNIIELFDGDDFDVNTGECLITDLFTYSFPLIRYRLGDILETEIRNGVRVINKIKGRFDDWIFLEDGTRIPFQAFYEVMERRHEIRQFRIIQETYRLVRVQAVCEKGYDRQRVEEIVVQDLKNEVPGKLDYSIDWRDTIPPGPNGKLRMIISRISQN